eukprot:1604497-Pyramimonas_sp.AAC.1
MFGCTGGRTGRSGRERGTPRGEVSRREGSEERWLTQSTRSRCSPVPLAEGVFLHSHLVRGEVRAIAGALGDAVHASHGGLRGHRDAATHAPRGRPRVLLRLDLKARGRQAPINTPLELHRRSVDGRGESARDERREASSGQLRELGAMRGGRGCASHLPVEDELVGEDHALLRVLAHGEVAPLLLHQVAHDAEAHLHRMKCIGGGDQSGGGDPTAQGRAE